MITDKNKKSNNWIDRITEKDLKIAALFFGFLSLISEFFPSLFNVCKMFNYNIVIVFLQPHKDFFVNIFLGFTGSAFISYIILHKSNKLKKDEQQKIISNMMKKIIYKYSVIYNLLSSIIKDEDGKNYSIQKDEEIKLQTQNLLILIQDFQKCYEDSLINNKIIDDFSKFCEDKIMLFIEEIFDFLHTLNEYRKIKTAYLEEDIFKKLNISMYKFLYENLADYINSINKYFNDISPYDFMIFSAQVSYAELSEKMEDYFKTEFRAKRRAIYHAKLFQVDQDAFSEVKKREVEKIKKKIISNVCDNLDLFSYGEKRIEEGQVLYIVNEEKMSVEKYKEYCIKKEFERRGLIK